MQKDVGIGAGLDRVDRALVVVVIIIVVLVVRLRLLVVVQSLEVVAGVGKLAGRELRVLVA